jgi:hypothetical protein
METRNGREGREDARQIAPGVARSDYRAGWAIVVIALVFLFCPGCGEGDADPLSPALLLGGVGVVAAALAWTIRTIMARRERAVWLDIRAALYESLDAARKREATWKKHADDNLAGWGKANETSRIANDGWRAARERAEAAELELDGARTRIRDLEAALDVCAEFFDDKKDPRGSGVYAKAREALRATGRLGGPRADAAEPKPEPATLCRCGHTNRYHIIQEGERRPCLGKLADGHFCPCEALDVVAQAAGSGA